MTTRHMHYTCGCEYVRDLASRSCPYHPSHPAIESAPAEPTPPHTGWGVGNLRDCHCLNCQGEPTPEPPTETECCREPIAADERFCQKCGHEARIQPAGEPAPCVWREEWVEYGNNHGRDEVKTGCGLSEDADEMRPLMKWPFCPQCGSPLQVER